MKEKIKDYLKNLIARLAASLKRFPEALLLAFSVVVLLIYINHHSVPSDSALVRSAMVLALGVPLALGLKMLWERGTLSRKMLVPSYGAAALALFMYYSFLLTKLDMVSGSRYVGISAALYLLFLAIPYLGRKEGFEMYVIKLFTGFIATYFYALILFAGLAAILFTINTLFAAGISEEVYFDLWLMSAGVFAPTYFLAGVPAYGEELSVEDYPTFLRVLLLYIVMPLLAVYTGILYVYFIKILVTHIWPAGMVSNLVLWYSFISLAVVFFLYQMKDKNTWAHWFEMYLPRLILPLLIMMFVAMGIRIEAYGVTENRYLVLAGGVWSSGCMLYCALIRKRMNIGMVISAAVIAVLVVSGPWSCYAVSKYSQNARFERILLQNHMLADGKIVPSQQVSTADQRTLSSILQYFQNSHNLTDVKYLPADFKMNKMNEIFGFSLAMGRDTHFSHNIDMENNEMQDIRDYDYSLPMVRGTVQKPVARPGELILTYDPGSTILTLSRDGQALYQKELSSAALAIHSAHIGQNVLGNKDMTYVDENETVKIMLLFTNISGSEDNGDGQPRIEWLDFSVFVSLK